MTFTIDGCSIVRLTFKPKNIVRNRFIMQPKKMGNYFHLRIKSFYDNFELN